MSMQASKRACMDAMALAIAMVGLQASLALGQALLHLSVQVQIQQDHHVHK